MKKPIVLLFALAAPLLSAQTEVAYWEALHYSLKLEWVSARGETLTEASLERSELFLVTSGKEGTTRTLVGTERGFANAELSGGEPQPGVIYTLAGQQGTRYQLRAQKGGLAVTRQGVEWRENVVGNIALTGSPVTFLAIPLTKTDLNLVTSVIVEARELFSRELSLQPKRMHGNDVWVLQRCLLDENYTEVGEIDGWFGPNTRKAVTQFQRNVGLPVTGIVDADT